MIQYATNKENGDGVEVPKTNSRRIMAVAINQLQAGLKRERIKKKQGGSRKKHQQQWDELIKSGGLCEGENLLVH
jgi:hypothetical protein